MRNPSKPGQVSAKGTLGPQRHSVTASGAVGGRRQGSASGSGTLGPSKPGRVTATGRVGAAGKVTGTGKVRKWSPGSDVACCSAEALGFLLDLSDADVLALYWATAAGPDEGASIPDTLEAAADFSKILSSQAGNFALLASQPLGYRDLAAHLVAEQAGVLIEADEVAWPPATQPASRSSPFADAALAIPAKSHGLILGMSLPEPHAIAVTPDGTWWSWGEPFEPGDWPELVVEEAWGGDLTALPLRHGEI
jgi:hypothetical protein